MKSQAKYIYCLYKNKENVRDLMDKCNSLEKICYLKFRYLNVARANPVVKELQGR